MNANHASSHEPVATQTDSTFLTFQGNEDEIIHELKHYLPAQAPLKDFIHHNTLHAFQHLRFFEGLQQASKIFGYRVSFSLHQFRSLYASKKIDEDILDRILTLRKGQQLVPAWKEKMLSKKYEHNTLPRIGNLRANWKRHYHIDLDSMVHPILFRIICSYLDQGISMWRFPVWHKGFLASIRELERNSFTSFFRTKRARAILLEDNHTIATLLHILIGNKTLNKQYLFDQQFAHQGWSGMVASVEDQPQNLLDTRKISLREFIYFELLLEIDALDSTFGEIWSPLANKTTQPPQELFSPIEKTELDDILILWQEAFEWSHYDQVLGAIQQQPLNQVSPSAKTFQAMFCIDDRASSLRHYLEKLDSQCETFGTLGFFNVEFFFKPKDGKFYTKLCPAPVMPKYLIQETGEPEKKKKDVHLTKHTHTLFRGWIITQTLGFAFALRLFLNVFRPTVSPASASSFNHMNKISGLIIENANFDTKENGLQIGFTIDEMAARVESLLKGIGLVKDFAPVVYVIGHGSSSVNNPHYAAYDCGACSGRPGSVNARVLSFMANNSNVRAILKGKGIDIPESTQFIGALHDTTRDEIMFFDDHSLLPDIKVQHQKNENVFKQALVLNAKERSRRFESINTKQSSHRIHAQVKQRAVSLFEPRPELNHATNSLCIVGRRSLSKNIFLDRRAFLNSYDYTLDPKGDFLLSILKPIGPVCGGINLEYFFSRVDNQKLGAGTKLPHNVMGLFGVANGIEGDLRPGLPSQMVEVHDPIRLMLVVEHFPDVVLEVIKRSPEIYQWYIHQWIHLIAVNPITRTVHVFNDGSFTLYLPLRKVPVADDINVLIESTQENIPIHILSQP